jgi:hypothetical protein
LQLKKTRLGVLQKNLSKQQIKHYTTIRIGLGAGQNYRGLA